MGLSGFFFNKVSMSEMAWTRNNYKFEYTTALPYQSCTCNFPFSYSTWSFNVCTEWWSNNEIKIVFYIYFTLT